MKILGLSVWCVCLEYVGDNDYVRKNSCKWAGHAVGGTIQAGRYGHRRCQLFRGGLIIFPHVFRNNRCVCVDTGTHDLCAFHVNQAHDQAKASAKRAIKTFSVASKQLATSRSAHAKAVSRYRSSELYFSVLGGFPGT